jgi:hypothetical protein
MKLLIAEVLEKVKNTKTFEGKVKVLRQEDSPSLRQVLYANFSEKVKFLIPETPAPFKPSVCPLGIADTNLFREARRLYLFVQGGHPKLDQPRREQLWIQLLEGLAKEEAAVLESLKNKKLGSDYDFDINAVLAAFPDIQLPKPVAGAVATTTTPESVVAVAPVTEKRKRGRPKKVQPAVVPVTSTEPTKPEV